MFRALALTAACLFCVTACNREHAQEPAPDVAREAAVPAGPEAPEETAEAPHSAGEFSAREPDFVHLAAIRNARATATGKLARMYLKYDRTPVEGHVVMRATDGSYLSAGLTYEPDLAPLIKQMEPGYLYEVEFEVTGVSTGGRPEGKILAVDRQTSQPVADQTRFLPAVQQVEQAEQLSEEEKRARREELREALESLADSLEKRAEESRSR